VSNIVEFGLDLDPARADARLLPQPQSVNQSGQSFLTLTWQPRDPGNAAFCEITAQQSTDPAAWTNLPASAIVSGPPNTRTASVPMAAGQRGWMRLKVRQTGP
jgi:hypothetical protein